jgi:hypothetical protein
MARHATLLRSSWWGSSHFPVSLAEPKLNRLPAHRTELRINGPRFFAKLMLLCSIFVTPLAFSGDATNLDRRVACEAALADLAWNELIWPEANPAPKPARETVLSDATLRARVEDRLRMERVLAEDYGVHVDARMLQRELDRIAGSTRAPERLALRFASLDHDPVLIGECLVRPPLVASKLRAAYGYDARRHGPMHARAERLLAAKARGHIADLEGAPVPA